MNCPYGDGIKRYDASCLYGLPEYSIFNLLVPHALRWNQQRANAIRHYGIVPHSQPSRSNRENATPDHPDHLIAI
ncbi:hypothetical protein [Gracilimonas amylolytica]|uniref:hypothetical protein n=1 Tax=Gracilimonas amylolytica TaxID=1749045 RepID=UPI0012FFD4A0|nr:hypothetical protein [Gracilimonas amylolytica]